MVATHDLKGTRGKMTKNVKLAKNSIEARAPQPKSAREHSQWKAQKEIIKNSKSKSRTQLAI